MRASIFFALRLGNDPHAMVAAVGEDLEGGARLRDVRFRRPAWALEGEFRRSELAVEAGFRSARRIQVVQTDERRRRRLDTAMEVRLRAARVDGP